MYSILAVTLPVPTRTNPCPRAALTDQPPKGPAYHAPHPERPTAWMTVKTNWAPKTKKNTMKLKELSALGGRENTAVTAGPQQATPRGGAGLGGERDAFRSQHTRPAQVPTQGAPTQLPWKDAAPRQLPSGKELRLWCFWRPCCRGLRQLPRGYGGERTGGGSVSHPQHAPHT